MFLGGKNVTEWQQNGEHSKYFQVQPWNLVLMFFFDDWECCGYVLGQISEMRCPSAKDVYYPTSRAFNRYWIFIMKTSLILWQVHAHQFMLSCMLLVIFSSGLSQLLTALVGLTSWFMLFQAHRADGLLAKLITMQMADHVHKRYFEFLWISFPRFTALHPQDDLLIGGLSRWERQLSHLGAVCWQCPIFQNGLV